MDALKIASKIWDYQVHFKKNFGFIDELASLENSVFVIDSNVYSIYSSEFHHKVKEENVFILNAIEANKNLDQCQKIYSFLTQKSAKRNLKLISIGGGITQDITGFVASTLYRGIKWTYIPTTLLAQTDSCIGSKTSLNFGKFKNLLGTFYPPQQIFINIDFLKTLSMKDFYSGLGESIKFSLMSGDKLSVSDIKKNIERCKIDDQFLIETIRNNMQIKISYMEGDEFDLGRRNLLNYGHCLGHALETTSNYEIPHGIAVNIGIIFANYLSTLRDELPRQITEQVANEINIPNISIELNIKHFDKDGLLRCLKNDKKSIGKDLTLILPDRDFNLIRLTDIHLNEYYRALECTLKIIFQDV